jgi:monoamine oxidase
MLPDCPSLAKILTPRRLIHTPFLLRLLTVVSLWVLGENGAQGFGGAKSEGLNEPSAPPTRVEVVVIGGGLAGLTTAYRLVQKGIDVVLLEGSPRIGGRVKTVTYSLPGEPSVSADSGMEEYWESNPGVSLLKELELPLRADFATSSIRLGGQTEWLSSGESAPEFLRRILKPEERSILERFKSEVALALLKLQRESDTVTREHPLVRQSFAQWVGRRVTSAKVRDWIRVSLECEIGTGWDRIAAIDGISEFHIFLDPPGTAPDHQGSGEKSYRVRGGNEAFTRALARKIGASRIFVNQFVKEVRQETVEGRETATLLVLDTASHQTRRITADRVVSTLPLYRLNEIQFSPPLSKEKREAIGSQSWGSYFKAHFLLKPGADRFWRAGDHSRLPLLSDSELGVIYDGNPDQAHGPRVLSLLITGDFAEGFNWAPQDAVRQKLSASLEKLWPGIGREVLEVHLYRYHPRAIAGWPVGRSRFDELSRAVRTPEGVLHLAGDFTENTHSSGAFLSADRVVRQILKAKADSKEPSVGGRKP